MPAPPRRSTQLTHCGRGAAAAITCLLAAGQLAGVSAQAFTGTGFPKQEAPLHCPESGPWSGLLQQINRGAAAFRSGDFASAKSTLADAAEAATADVKQAFTCSLGISSLFRALAFAYCTDSRLEGPAMRRANQIGLRFLHIAMNWLTHTFVTTNHNQPLIDGSAWPIGIQEINDDLTAVSSAIRSSGPTGHAPTMAGSSVPFITGALT